MSRKLICLISFVLLLGLAGNASADLIGHWGFDEGSGNVAYDTSGGENHGVLVNEPQWDQGILGGALSFGDGSNVQVNNVLPAGDFTVMLWINTSTPADHGPTAWAWDPIVFAGIPTVISFHDFIWAIDEERMGGQFNGGTYHYNNGMGVADVVTGNWEHVACIRDTSANSMTFYVNGVFDASAGFSETAALNDNPTMIFGWNAVDTQHFFTGLMDDIRIYNHALSTEELMAAVLGPEFAQTLTIADGQEFVPRDAVLSWTPGLYANTHDVYFGTDPDALTLVGPGQNTTTYDPDGLLDWGQTYYWRIDEVQADPNVTIRTGDIWSFTAEPIGYPINIVTATASSTNSASEGPENTINGSGLDADDLHAAENDTMWLSNFFDSGPVWIQYDFDRLYKLNDMSVWNHNSLNESNVGYGIKEATIEYSVDGTNWTPLGTQEFAQAPGEDGYAANTTVDLGVAAQSVRITANSNWGDGFLPQFGLSEVQYTSTPVRARNPQPESGATDVGPDVILGWSAGREAAEHSLYLSKDEQTVIDGTADMTPLVDSSYSTSLDLDSEYFWRVDEVNNDETPPIWVGDVWSLTTPEFLVVEDFESYSTAAGEEIFNAWVDGYEKANNGALVGYGDFGEMEQVVVYGGMQSMPFYYDNTTTAVMSEATRTFTDAQDWSKGGIKGLTLTFSGESNNVAQQMYVKINGHEVPYDGSADNLTKSAWQMWYIDLTLLSVSNVTELTIGFKRIGASGGLGTVLIDAVRLYARDRQLVTPVDPGTAGLVGHWKFDEGGGATAFDETGNGHDGAINGAQATEGQIGEALLFDEIDDHVSVPDFDYGTDYTIAFWLKSSGNEGTGWQYVFSHAGWNAPNSLNIFFGENSMSGFEGTLRTLLRDADDADATDMLDIDAGLADGNWHHYALTVASGIGADVYIDGALKVSEQSRGGDAFDPATDLFLGGRSDLNSARFFGGALDDVRIYDRALTEVEVAGLAGGSPYDEPF